MRRQPVQRCHSNSKNEKTGAIHGWGASTGVQCEERGQGQGGGEKELRSGVVSGVARRVSCLSRLPLWTAASPFGWVLWCWVFGCGARAKGRAVGCAVGDGGRREAKMGLGITRRVGWGGWGGSDGS